MHKIIHRADSRGYFDYGWLKTHHSFSFGSWYDPNRTNFGMLRVLNDDIVEAGRGFGTHRHENMEIVSIPLSGSLAHKDSAGHEEEIKLNEIQVMSAGTGISHSEYNHSANDMVNFLQIWILPDRNGHEPRYDQKFFDPSNRKNKFQTVIAPKNENAALWLNQDAYFSLGSLEGGKRFEYQMHSPKNGVYVFLIEGTVEVFDDKLKRRDAIGICDSEQIEIKATEQSEILVIEIPMS